MLGGQDLFFGGVVLCLWVEHRPCFFTGFLFRGWGGVGLGSCAFFFHSMCVFFVVRGGGGLILPTVDVICGVTDNRFDIYIYR